MEEFHSNKCIFLELLADPTRSSIYINNVQFIEAILAKTLKLPSKNAIAEQIHLNGKEKKERLGKRSEWTNLIDKIFNLLDVPLQIILKERRLGKSNPLL